jgi:hypothetical protein
VAVLTNGRFGWDVVTPGSRLKFYYKKHQSILGSGVLEGDLADWDLGAQAKIFIDFDESTGLMGVAEVEWKYRHSTDSFTSK